MTEASLNLLRLTLTEFRNYKALSWQPRARMAVLTGPNGSGKTNLLEALSLLVPGRGLRAARPGDWALEGGTGRWAVAAQFERAGVELAVGTGVAPDGPPERPSDRRVFRLDGAAPRSQAEVAEVLAATWLTPQAERLFTDPASARRRFLDRLVWALEPGHAREVSSFETAFASRNRLLRDRADSAWLTAVEDSMARHAVAVTAARLHLLARLNATPAPGAFPAVRAELSGELAGSVASGAALDAEDRLRTLLADSRARDAASGTATEGAHRTDLLLSDAASGLPAARASTGQQKALLMGLVLAHARLIEDTRGVPALLLLDEPLVHLDRERRTALFDTLAAGRGPVLLTGTDPGPFAPLAGLAEQLQTGDGMLRPVSFGTVDPVI